MDKPLARWIIVCTALVAVVMLPLAGTVYAMAQVDDTDNRVGPQSEAFESEVIRLVNLERTSRGLYPLRLNSQLTDAARIHNQDMIVNNFFDHTGSDGSSPDERACAQGYVPYGWGDCYVAENIAAGYTTPADVVDAWMDSPGHRDNILSARHREIGVGHATGGTYGNYYTMVLGAQPNVLPVFINDDASETSSRQVNVTLTKEDVSSWGSIGTITGVQLSEDPTFAGATWQAWSQTVSFTLSSGNEVKTLYVRFTDGSQQITSSDTILLYEPVPSLTLSPERLLFLAEMGSGQTTPAVAYFNVLNDGGDTLHWVGSDDQSWLVMGSSSGDAPASVSVWVDNSGGVLNSLGRLTATITVSATNPDAVNTPQSIPAVLHVVEEVYPVHLPLIHKP